MIVVDQKNYLSIEMLKYIIIVSKSSLWRSFFLKLQRIKQVCIHQNVEKKIYLKDNFNELSHEVE